MRGATLLAALVVCACAGPPASDAEVCRDYIHRVCIPPVCTEVAAIVDVTACEATLLARSGCGADDFTFTTPARDRFLSCRVALLRAAQNPEAHPNCEDVAESFDRCPDVVRFLEGKK